jgi:hypothetical protein
MEQEREALPLNIERLREEWKAQGLYPEKPMEPQPDESGDNGFDELSYQEPIEVRAVFGAGAAHRANVENRASEMEEAIKSLKDEIHDLKESQAKDLQEFRESYLLELRNLKGQELDLASLVYELTEELRQDKTKKSWFRLKK